MTDAELQSAADRVLADMPPLARDVPILLYMPAFHGGGAENAVVRLANHWQGEGRRVTIIVNKVRGPVIDRVTPGIEVVDLGSPLTARAWPRLGRLLKERRPPLLVTALLGPNVAGLTAARRWSPETAVVSLVRNFTTEEIAGRDPIRRALFPPLLRYAYRRTDAIGCVAARVSEDIAAFAGIPAAKVATTLNPVPLPDAAKQRPRPDDWPAGGPVIVAMGRLVPQKDYRTLLSAFAKLAGAPVLLVLGEGPLRPELEAQARALGIAKRVHLIGFRAHPDDYLAHADLFVLASKFEGFPNVLAEALALGCTAVATDAPGGAGEILAGGRYGYLTAVGDAPALAGALQRGLDAPISPAVARARAEQFAVGNVARLYEALFASAMASRRAVTAQGGRAT